MARIVFTAVVESIRGSIAGTTFQKNKHGYSVKKKPSMVHPASFRQTRSKRILSQVSRAWRDLTQTQRDLYITFASTYPQYAKHAPTSQLTGYEVFVKYNCLRLLAGYSVDLTPELSIPDSDTLVYSVVNDSGVLSIIIDSDTEDEEWNCLFFISRNLTGSQRFIGSRPKYIRTVTNMSDSANITSAYLELYGSVPDVGDIVALDVLLISGDSPMCLARDSQLYTIGTTP